MADLMQKKLMLLLGFLFLLEHTLCESNIVDFSYSEYVPSKKIEVSSKLSFHADSSSLQGYEFPEVCHATSKLQQFRNVEISSKATQHSQAYVGDLKDSFIDFLKLGEKLKKKKKNIVELGGLNSRVKNLSIPESDLSVLKAKQSTLQSIDREIKIKTELLENLINQSIQQTENTQFTHSWLDFQIQFLRHRREYLLKALRDATSTTRADENDYDGYFVNLKAKFDDESAMFSELNHMLTDSHLLIELKAQLSTLKSKILIGEMLYKEKLECQQEILKIKQTQKTSMQMKIKHLRQLKKQESSNNHHYCEGITRKLEDQLRNVLRTYDYTFECVEGIDAVELELLNNKQKLKGIEQKIKEIEGEEGINTVLYKLSQNNENLETRAKEIEKFSIPNYQNDPLILQSLIDEVQNSIQKAEQEKKMLETPGRRGHSRPPLDYQRVQESILEIKRLKATYCQEYDAYQRKSHEIWSRIYQFEADLEYEKKISSMYESQVRDLKNLELDFESVKDRLILKMQ